MRESDQVEPLSDLGELRASRATETDLRARRRLLGVLGLAVVVAFLLTLLVQALGGSGEPGEHRRSTFSVRADGYRGIFEVLERLGFRVERWRRSYGQLPDPRESVLVIVDPIPSAVLGMVEGTRVDPAQLRSLQSWLSSGGRLVFAPGGELGTVLFGVELDTHFDAGEASELFTDLLDPVVGEDRPARHWQAAFGALRGSGELAGLESSLEPPAPGKERLVPMYLGLSGDRDPPAPLTRDRELAPRIEVFEPDYAAQWRELVFLSGFPFVVAREKGEGEIWYFASALPFTNLAVAEGNAARLLAAVASAASERGRRVLYFDEYCHGLWERRGLFGWIWGTSLVYPAAGAWVLFALFLWRGVVRLGSPDRLRTRPRRAKEEYVVSLADICHRAGRYRAAGEWIVEAYRRQLAARLGDRGTRGPSEELAELHEGVRTAARFGEAELVRSVRRAERIYRQHLDSLESGGKA